MRTAELDHIKSYSVIARDDYAELAHFIWRLGATRSNANKVVEAMTEVPSLYRISEIRRAPAPAIVEKTLHPNSMSPHEILHEVIADSQSINPLQWEQAFRRLHQLDQPVTRPIKNAMAARETFPTRVHAELQIADIYSRIQEMKFVEDRKSVV